MYLSYSGLHFIKLWVQQDAVSEFKVLGFGGIGQRLLALVIMRVFALPRRDVEWPRKS